MDELANKVAFIEARLTLLERKFGRAAAESAFDAAAGASLPAGPIYFTCSDPGLVISTIHPEERDSNGSRFCWIGNDGPLQIVLPVRPVRDVTCSLTLMPHPRVEAFGLSIIANDEPRPTIVRALTETMLQVSFDVAASGASNINVILLGLNSIRPSDFGENADTRLLGARFYEACVTFSS